MIVSPELHDLPRTITPESNSSSSAGGGSGDHRSSTSNDSSTKETPRWESKVISGRLDNLRKAPKTLPAGFRFRAALHHKVVDGPATVKWYKKLEEMVRQYQIPRTILIRARTQNEQACTVSRTGWVPVYVDYFDAEVGNANKGGGLQVALPVPSMPFHQLNKIERMNNKLAARISEWYTPNAYMNYPQLSLGDVDLKNRVLDLVKARGLVDLEALVTPEQLVLLGFVDVANLHAEGEMSSILERQRQQAQSSRNRGAGSGSQRQTWFDERPLTAPGRSSSHRSSSYQDIVPSKNLTLRPQPTSAAVTWSANMPPASAREVAEPAPAPSSVSRPRIAYPEGFNYVRIGYQVAMVNELREELEKAQAKKESGSQAAKEEASCAEDRAKKAESDREKAFHELNSLKDMVVEANQHVARVEASLEQSKRHHQHAICFARAQGAEWLVGADIWPSSRGRRWTNKERASPLQLTPRGEDTEGLPSFDAWVVEPQEVPAEPSNIPPASQPAAAPTLSPLDWSSPARFIAARTDVSIFVNLTND
ncbi:hypothetical protein SLEP1_g26223 [Rubroshorea leprosula]|uniref:Uncharacterized protein n=1 Tax=Rubroshorea leprosula TaxID=152421 RepID=A0AAV5JVP4_9ROSI|nr:hypothetical protein SLEP1_g26223 [Rubroshorea leprosula]